MTRIHRFKEYKRKYIEHQQSNCQVKLQNRGLILLFPLLACNLSFGSQNTINKSAMIMTTTTMKQLVVKHFHISIFMFFFPLRIYIKNHENIKGLEMQTQIISSNSQFWRMKKKGETVKAPICRTKRLPSKKVLTTQKDVSFSIWRIERSQYY